MRSDGFTGLSAYIYRAIKNKEHITSIEFCAVSWVVRGTHSVYSLTASGAIGLLRNCWVKGNMETGVGRCGGSLYFII